MSFIIDPFRHNSDDRVFGVVGDSNADGRGTTVPTVASSTLFLWSGSAFNQITTTSVSNDATSGSIWQQFATDYKAATAKPVYLVNGGSGGAEFYPNGDNNNWYTSGTLYAAWKIEMDEALATRRASLPTAIFICCGINDDRGGTSIANITTGVNSLISRLTTDYPGTAILIIQQGRHETLANDESLYDLRSLLVATANANTNVHICANAASFIGVTGGYNADNLHYSQATNNTIGSMLARWFINGAYSKWARSIISSMHDALSSGRKTLIDNFINAQIANGNYFKLESLILFKTTTTNNIFVDWTMIGYTALGPNSITFVANSHVTVNGTNQYIALPFTSSIYDRAATYTDFITGFRLTAKTTASGTSAVAMGRSDGTNILRIAQSTTSTNYHANVTSANIRTGSEVTFATPATYSVARNGGTEYFFKDKTEDANSTVAASAACSSPLLLGSLDGSTFWFGGSFTYVFAAKYSDLDFDALYDDLGTLIAGW